MKNRFYFVLLVLLFSISSIEPSKFFASPSDSDSETEAPAGASSSGDGSPQRTPLTRDALANPEASSSRDDFPQGAIFNTTNNDLDAELDVSFSPKRHQLPLSPGQFLAASAHLPHPTPLYGAVRRTQDLQRLHEQGRHHPYGTPQGRRDIFDRRIYGAAVRDAVEAGVGTARRLNLNVDTEGVPTDLVSPDIVSAIVEDEPTNRLLRTIADLAPQQHTPLPPSLPDLGHLVGDQRGGGHRLSESKYIENVDTPTQQLHGTPPLTHPRTGVWAGRYRPARSTTTAYKTGFPSADILTDQQLNSLHRRPTRILGRSNGRTLERWEYSPPSSPETTQELFVERISHPERYVDTTFYPIWDHQTYTDGSTTDIVIPEVGTYSPAEILGHAKQLLDTHDSFSDNLHPARYTSRRTVTVDIAPALGSPLIKKGVYVTFPRRLFTDEQLEG